VLDAGASLALVDFDGSDFRLLPAHSQDDGMPAFYRAARGLRSALVHRSATAADRIAAYGSAMPTVAMPGDSSRATPPPGPPVAGSHSSASARSTAFARTGSANEIAWSPDGRRLLIVPNDLMTVDLRGNFVHDYGESWYSGADDVWQMNGIAWQPLPR
jgi:hypothetical protein